MLRWHLLLVQGHWRDSLRLQEATSKLRSAVSYRPLFSTKAAAAAAAAGAAGGGGAAAACKHARKKSLLLLLLPKSSVARHSAINRVLLRLGWKERVCVWLVHLLMGRCNAWVLQARHSWVQRRHAHAVGGQQTGRGSV